MSSFATIQVLLHKIQFVLWIFLGGPMPKLPESLHLFPTYNFPPAGDVVGSTVLVLQVIGMLPHVQNEDGKETVSQGTVLHMHKKKT